MWASRLLQETVNIYCLTTLISETLLTRKAMNFTLWLSAAHMAHNTQAALQQMNLTLKPLSFIPADPIAWPTQNLSLE